MRYIVFLRGINVGGNKKVSIKVLQKTFEDVGFSNVKTLLNSGNVIFDSKDDEISLQKKITDTIEKTFGFSIPVLFRRHRDIVEFVRVNPFKNFAITPATRLYVTFLGEYCKTPFHFPYTSSGKSFQIVDISSSAVFSILTLSKTTGTTDMMRILEKEFGKNITTRNWNTIVKLSCL